MTDLNTLIDPQQLGAGPQGSDELIWANAINDAGQITAGGWNWYVLTPIPEVLPGDFNNDGTVGAADYVVWRDNYGMPSGAMSSGGDGDRDGDVDGADFLV